MSNAKQKGKRKGSKAYREHDRLTKNKARRVERDKRRANLQDCGHGIRHFTHPDGACRRCWAERAMGA